MRIIEGELSYLSREEKIDQGRNNRRSFLETLILYFQWERNFRNLREKIYINTRLRIANNRRRTLISREEKIDRRSFLETLILYVSMGKKFSKLKRKDISYLRIANNRSKRTLISREEKIDRGRNGFFRGEEEGTK